MHMHVDAIQYQYSHFGAHLFPLGSYYNCFGNESSLSGCRSHSSPCRSDDVAGVHCKGDQITGILYSIYNHYQAA